MTTSSTGTSPKYQLYKPFGEVRYTSGTLPTKYTFTGQYSNVSDFGLMYYGARWYDVSLGRFAQADTIIPGAGNPMAWDRYAYTLNSPLMYTDPSGHMVSEGGGGGVCSLTSCSNDDPTVIVFGGSYTTENINNPGPDPADQLPAWNWNPWGYDMQYVSYPGSKFEQTQDAESLGITGSTILICYSAGAEACLLYASSHTGNDNSVPSVVLIGATFTGSDIENGLDIGYEGWKSYLNNTLT